jgi:hypothetical protein
VTRLLLCTAMLLLFASTTPSSAQREGGAFFGPFSRGSSMGGDFTPPAPPCTYITGPQCPKTERPKAGRTTGKKGR